ncbi:hypothetical protein M413DRAFT_23333 [Hebeloma cylindrosporum]|uniref:F-box domain-containing protein n=1 Tax=Hebeloma cylindrosporum TaxID=76867 RepID=A0A0C3CE26_HEBCY|nr:hypothetical protein M413DRAFT_23333 [Hebeloma cylindrosporum h7]
MPSKCFSPFSRLSQEIIDKIIDHIADASIIFRRLGFFDRDLPHCALVSRSFRPRSEFHVFEILHLKEKSDARQRKLETLAGLIQGNPKIADYIRELSLECVDLEYSWIGEDPMFLDIMRAVSRPEQPLRRLAFQHDASSDRPLVKRFDNKTEFQPLLNNFFRPLILPFITTLALMNMEGVPLEVVEGCVHLIDLELDHVTFVGKSSKTALNSTRPALKRLWDENSKPPLWDTHPLDGWDASFDLSQLQYLAVFRDEPLDFKFEQHIVDMAGGSLQELQLHSSTRTGCEPFVSLRNSPKLSPLDTDIFLPEDNLRSINRILKTIQTTGSLHAVSIRLYIVGFDGEAPEILLNADWETFCIEVLRVRSTAAFTITLSMIYTFGHPNPDMELSVFWDHLNNRCESTLSRLLEEKIASLVDSPGCINDLSHMITTAEDYY